MNGAYWQDRWIENDAELDRIGTSLDCTGSCVCITVAVTTYPTSASRFYGVQRVILMGDETEGAAASVVPIDGVFFAANLGAAVPPVGTWVVCHGGSGRWAFRYDG